MYNEIYDRVIPKKSYILKLFEILICNLCTACVHICKQDGEVLTITKQTDLINLLIRKNKLTCHLDW